MPGCPCIYSCAAKTERLKQAKDEAEREIIAYKREREAEFKRKVSCEQEWCAPLGAAWQHLRQVLRLAF